MRRNLVLLSTLVIAVSMSFGQSDRGTVLTAEGMAISGSELLLMPEDDPSRVFVHKWVGATMSETAPTRPNEPEKSLFRRPVP